MKPKGTHGALIFLIFHLQPNTAGCHGGGSVESWDRQRVGQILGPGRPEERQVMQTAWNVARLQSDLSPHHHSARLCPLSLCLLYHTSGSNHCFQSLSWSPHFYFLGFIVPFYFLFLISLSSPPSSCSDVTQYLLRLNQSLHPISDSSVRRFLRRGRVCWRLNAT